MDNWTHAEILQLIGIVAASTASIVGGVITVLMQRLSRKVNVIRLEQAIIRLDLNSRLSHLLLAAKAEGIVQERAAQDARDVAKSTPVLTSAPEDGAE